MASEEIDTWHSNVFSCWWIINTLPVRAFTLSRYLTPRRNPSRQLWAQSWIENHGAHHSLGPTLFHFFFLTSLKSILYSNKLCQQVEEARQNAAGWARQHRKSMTPTNWQPLERPIDYVVAHDRIPTFRPTRRFLLFWGGTKSNEWKKTRKSSAAGGKSWTSNCVHTVRTSVILTPERSFFRRLNRN